MDAIVVLGAGLRGDRPSPLLARRLDKAIQIHRSHSDAVIIVSGGRGEDEVCSEAHAMAEYLRDRSGSPVRGDEDNDGRGVHKEDRATSTEENLAYSRDLLPHVTDRPTAVAVVTSDFHMFRTRQTVEHVWGDDGQIRATVVGARTPLRALPKAYVREAAAIVWNAAKRLFR